MLLPRSCLRGMINLRDIFIDFFHRLVEIMQYVETYQYCFTSSLFYQQPVLPCLAWLLLRRRKH